METGGGYVVPNAVPGEVDADTIIALGIIDGPFAIVWGLIAACFYAGYRSTKSYHAEIQRKLQQRAAESADLPA